MANSIKGEVVYEEEMRGRVNPEGDTEEVILRGVDSVHTLVLYLKGGKRHKFQSDYAPGYTITVTKNPLPEAADGSQGQEGGEASARAGAKPQ